MCAPMGVCEWVHLKLTAFQQYKDSKLHFLGYDGKLNDLIKNYHTQHIRLNFKILTVNT